MELNHAGIYVGLDYLNTYEAAYHTIGYSRFQFETINFLFYLKFQKWGLGQQNQVFHEQLIIN